MKIKSKSQHFELACKLSEFGGKTPVGNNEVAQGHLEFNSITFTRSERFSIVSIDALYPPKNLDLPRNILVCSSHTHQAPMIDRGKPLLGDFSDDYLDRLKKFLYSPQDRSVDSRGLKLRCIRYKANVSIYRRADYSTSFIERPMNFLRRSIKSTWPNSALAIDQNIYIFLFESEEHAEFALIYYANHPVSRHDNKIISSDYIGVLRNSIRQRFNVECVIFLQGCSGDVRPNFQKRLLQFFRFSKFNANINYFPSKEDEALFDKELRKIQKIDYKVFLNLSHCEFIWRVHRIYIHGYGYIRINVLIISSKLYYIFMPFEVSHWYHLYHGGEQDGRYIFWVSSATEVLGYLPYETQLRYGGYEVNGSSRYMGRLHPFYLSSSEISKLFEEFTKFE